MLVAAAADTHRFDNSQDDSPGRDSPLCDPLHVLRSDSICG